MSLKDELSSKIAADREAGRDIPVVIEEMFLKIVDFLEPAETSSDEVGKPKESAPPVDNDHVAEGATKFTADEIAASASQTPAPSNDPASQAPEQSVTQ